MKNDDDDDDEASDDASDDQPGPSPLSRPAGRIISTAQGGDHAAAAAGGGAAGQRATELNGREPLTLLHYCLLSSLSRRCVYLKLPARNH